MEGANRCPSLGMPRVAHYGTKNNDLKELSFVLHPDMTMRGVGLARTTVYSVQGGDRLQAMRFLMDRFEPRSALTRRAHLKTIITNASARKIEDL